MDETQKRAATASLFERKGTAILGFPVKVVWLFDKENLGYTIGDNKKGFVTVYVSWDFTPITEPMHLNEDEKAMLRMGVFAHELLHQVLTDFKDTYETSERIQKEGNGRIKAKIFMDFMNLLEDPAIEHQGDSVFGGLLLKALRYSIATIYDSSPGIEESPDEFTQLTNALVNFGDMGIVKGHFTYPEARKYFLKVAPVYSKGIDEKDSKRRVDLAEQCYEITRPLWEKLLKDLSEEDRQKTLEELLKQLGAAEDPKSEGRRSDKSDSSSGNGNNSDNNSSSSSDKPGDKRSKADQRREKTLEAIKKALEAEEGEKSPSKNGASGGNEASAAEKGTEKDDKGSAGSGSDNSQKGASGDETSDTVKGADDCQADGRTLSAADDTRLQNGSGTDGDTDPLSDDARDGEDGDIFPSFKGTDLDPASDFFDSEAPLLTPEDCKELNKLIDDEFKNEFRRPKDTGDDVDVSIEGSALDMSASVCNVKADIEPGYAKEYADIVSSNRGCIRRLERSLSEIFDSDKETVVRSESGSYNILRGTAGTSARIFDKRRDPGSKKDCEVFLLVDMSGSMMGRKERTARDTAIIFGEALMDLKIPHYIMGFTGDLKVNGKSVDAYHTHFVTWNSSRRQHESLCGIKAYADNYDSYAIRTAKAVMDKRESSNKLIIVISDGFPAAMIYGSFRKGKAETAQALKEARKSAAVLGIGIGDIDAKEMADMYQHGFIHVPDESGLTNLLIKRLVKIVKDGFK